VKESFEKEMLSNGFNLCRYAEDGVESVTGFISGVSAPKEGHMSWTGNLSFASSVYSRHDLSPPPPNLKPPSPPPAMPGTTVNHGSPPPLKSDHKIIDAHKDPIIKKIGATTGRALLASSGSPAAVMPKRLTFEDAEVEVSYFDAVMSWSAVGVLSPGPCDGRATAQASLQAGLYALHPVYP
jgi:hypothetical protein